jgi:outer membrane receptor protein involved in Fe transport
MSSLKNYDLRFDYRPYDGGLFSISYFLKEIKDPIEFVQRVQPFTFTTPVNYPEGKLSGFEFEIRQRLGQFREELEGFSLGANATLIDSEVTLPADEAQRFQDLGFGITKRNMTNAPDRLYNIFLTYDLRQTGSRLGLFYTVRGDTLVAGAGEADGNFVPSVYETEFGTLNFTWLQEINDVWSFNFKAKNLLDPDIETVYRSRFIDEDITKTSYKKGMEFSVSLSAKF